MKTAQNRFQSTLGHSLLLLALGLVQPPAHGAATDLNDIPMAVSNQVKGNFLVVLDNSQSMDAFMGGALQSGNNPNTRGNIGRDILRGMLGNYRTSFNWGLMSFATAAPSLRDTYIYLMGDDNGTVLTDDCVAGISASNGNRRCVANPQPFAGGRFVTYDVSSDDPWILDVLYNTFANQTPQLWAYSDPRNNNSTTYTVYYNRNPNDTRWVGGAGGAFSGIWGNRIQFTATDAGYLPSFPGVTRQLFLRRGWGYNSSITGGGRLDEPVETDSAAHYNRLLDKLGSETNQAATPEIKNAAVFTPIAGTLRSAKDYFLGQIDWKTRARLSNSDPISAFCQKNFVMLLTDGLPTGKADGSLYSVADRTDTNVNGVWNFGTAANDSFTAVTNLRTVPYRGCNNCVNDFDVQTYVIAMGDTVANARAVAVMNEMASQGGTSNAFFANDPASLQNAISTVVNDAISRDGAAAAVAVANANVTALTSAFQAGYNSGSWTGDLQSYRLDLATGTPLIAQPLWVPSAQGQLDLLANNLRRIVSYSGTAGAGQGIPFRPYPLPPAAAPAALTTLSLSQQNSISAVDGPGIVNYIRGDRTGEGPAPAPVIYRPRTHVLGDIVNSEPVIVGVPSNNYNDATDRGYSAFKTAHAGRQEVVFQGANDGMLHAFNATTGAEEWAYVPNLLIPNLANLSLRPGFSHKFYVDGTPSVADVDFNRTGGNLNNPASDWRTLLVGGLNKGGYGYYALDVSAGPPATEAAAAANVLWEFPNSATAGQVVADLGFTFGKPIIAKTADQGWVVLVTSGYNNSRTVNVGANNFTGDGVGHLFVLNAQTGALIKDIPTGVGNNASPSGLAAISGYVESADVDNTVTQVYGGDMNGNVWRFDLTGPVNGWNVRRLATLVDAAGNAQPVTTAPELTSIIENNQVFRFVYVGTGRYLGDSDVVSVATQTMYGLIDDRTAAPTINPLRANLQQQTLVLQGNIRTATANTFDLTGPNLKRGWYVDLPARGERVNTDPQLALGTLVFTSNIPSGQVCVPGGSSFFNLLDYRTGGALAYGNLGWSSVSLGNALASRPVLIRLPSGEVRALIRKSDGTTITQAVPTPAGAPAIRRISWRELPDQQQ
jgi:type IV pilus assembly protein PilY1